MRKKLLSLNVTGVNDFAEGLKMSFVAEDQKNQKNIENDLIKVFENNEYIYVNKFNLIYGKNASGKTNILKLIDLSRSLSESNPNGITTDFSLYNNLDKEITMESFYSIDKYVFKQKITFLIEKIDYIDEAMRMPYKIKVVEEIISISNAVKPTLSVKKLISWFNDDAIWNEKSEVIFKTNISDSAERVDELPELTSNNDLINRPLFFEKVLSFFIAESFNKLKEKEKANQKFLKKWLPDEIEQVRKYLDRNVRLTIPDTKPHSSLIAKMIDWKPEVYLSFVNIFDKNIKKITWDKTSGRFSVDINNKIVLSSKLDGILSSGTLRGIGVMTVIKISMENGIDVSIDEIEANFNHKIIKYIFDLFKDNKVNSKGSRLFASTHYIRTLDITDRRDNIYITEKNNKTQNLIKLSHVEEVKKQKKRKDIPNSKLVKNIWTIDLEPSHADIVDLKKAFLK